MAVTIQGSDVELLIRTKSAGNFSAMVCEETVFLDVTNDVNTTKTKCGVFKGIQTPDFKLNGTATFNAVPDSGELSYDEVLAFQVDRTEIDWIIRNKAFGAYTAGELIRMSGTGYIVSTQFDGSEGQVSKFSWNIEGTGTINDTES